MKSKVAPAELPSSSQKLQIIGAIFFAIILGFGIWYGKNVQAQNIVSGVVSSPANILKSDNGRTNIIFMGIGGEGHEGGDLTDSILFVSFNLTNNTATMIPIPRDIWITSMQAKINTAYHYGGLGQAKTAVIEILGVPVHYALTLDFQGFVKAIDAVGGVDVQVERTFDDYQYPIAGMENAFPVDSRYEHIHFDAGTIHMDGTTALKFARSRHALGDEGTDFARGLRQQKIILAFKNKVFSLGTIFNSEILGNLKDSIASSIDTDIGTKEQGSFLKLALGLGNKDNIISIYLTDYFENPKNNKEYDNQWVLIPVPSLLELQSYVKNQLAQ